MSQGRSIRLFLVDGSPKGLMLSAAAAVVAGRSANGRTAWIVDGRALTYGAWQEQQLKDE